MIAGGVVAAAAAAVASAVTAVDAAVTLADLQWRHCTGIKGVGGRPPLAADFAKVSSF